MRLLTRFIAFRYAQSRTGSKLLGFIARLSMAGLVVAVTLLITVLSVMNGFEHELRTRILRVVPAITLYPSEGYIDHWQDVALLALLNKQVLAASPLIEAQGLIVAGQQSAPALLFATDPEAESRLSHFEEFAGSEAWARWRADPQSVLISKKMAAELSVHAGDTVVAFLPSSQEGQEQADIFGIKVAGIYETGTEIDNHLVLAQLPLLQKHKGTTGVAAVRFTVNNWLDASKIAWELVNTLPRGFALKTWLQTHGNLYQAIQVSRQMMVLMLALIVVVAAFNVVCSQVLVVLDKRGDIAILRAMGVPNGHIMRIFMLHGFLIGGTGTVIGALLGCALALGMPAIATGLQQLLGIQFLSTDIYPVNYLPSDLRLYDVLAVMGGALFLSALASIYPAWRATQLQPADILRHE